MIEKLGLGSCAEKPPIWNSEKPHGWQVFHCASDAAIFIALLAGDGLAEAVADRQLDQGGRAPRRSAPASPRGGTARRSARAADASSDAEHHHRAEDQAGEDRVHPGDQRELVRQQRPTLVSWALPFTIL